MVNLYSAFNMLRECQIRDILLSVKLPGCRMVKTAMSLARPISSNFTGPTVSIFGGYMSRSLDIFTKLSRSLRLRKALFVYLFVFFVEMTCAS